MRQDPTLDGRSARGTPRNVSAMQGRGRRLRRAARRLSAALVALTLVFAGVSGARAADYAAYVMDARTGETLYAKNAETALHPASLTKMMTLYLTIEAVKAGRLSLDQKVRVSAKASRQPPSRIGLKSGQYVTIRDLIRAAAIKSANDAAMALAEAVGGSEEAFARMMTEKAAEFGMTHTSFRNPHGLTAAGHRSSAHDMAELGRRLFFDHPEYYNLFSRKEETAVGRHIRNTNRRLLSSYEGADGIKTGYTSAAGYNLVASAHRGQQRVIVAVFGGRSSRSRNAEVARLLDLGFERSPRYARIVPPRSGSGAVASAPMPAFRPDGDGGESFAVEIARALGPSAAVAAEAPIPEAAIRARPEAPRRAEMPTSRPRAATQGVAMAVEFPTPRPR